MKPAFALDLDNDAVRLLSRAAEGWLEVGKVALEAADLDADLKALRDRAAALAPGGFITKLILPMSQILYTEVETPSNNRVAQRADIVNALKGRTPYPVSDLVFDWSRTGRLARVAVIARITLDEAEGFAETYGFNPVSFVAVPPAGKFGGEPFFGVTSRASVHLPEGKRLDRDQDPVRVIGALPEPETGVAAEPEEIVASVVADTIPVENALPEAAADATVSPEAERGPDPDETALPESAAPDEEEADPSDVAAPEVDAVTELEAGPEAAEAELSVPETVAEPAVAPEVEAAPLPEVTVPEMDEAAEADTLAPDSDEVALRDVAAPEAVGTEPDAASDEAPFIAIEEEDAEEAILSVLDSSLPEAAGDIDPPAFQSRRALVAQRPEDEEDLRSAANRLHLMSPVPELNEPRIAEGMAAITAPVLDIPHLLIDDDAAGTAAVHKRRVGLGRAALGPIPDAAHGTLAQQRLRRTDAAPPLPPLTAPIAEPVPTPERPRTKARHRSTAAAGRSPARTLAYLSGLLVLLMAAVALGSLFFSGDQPLPEEPVVATPQTPDSQTEDIIPPSDTTDTATDITPEPDAAPAETAADTVPEADTAPAVTDAAPEGQSPTDAAVATALDPGGTEGAGATDPAPLAVTEPRDVPQNAPAPTPQPEADAPGAPVISDAAAGPVDLAAPAVLPDAGKTVADAPPRRQPAPPPFGTVVTFGPGGLIVPKPEGVITPGGFTLFAGKPPVLPPLRPGSAAPAPIPAPATPDDGAALQPEATPAAQPATALALIGPKPKARPDALAPEVAAVPVPDAAAAPEVAAVPEVATAPVRVGPKPKARPDIIVATATAARNKANALAEAAAAAAKAEAERTASATAQAVASSRRPASRPQNFAKAVDAAVAAAVASAAASAPTPAPAPVIAPAPVVAAAPQPDPQEIDEPEPTAMAPNMPTTVTVARQATVKNAINLSEISLIGVFGSNASRRALIRMPTGRFIKVKVGDRFDGGTIAAIGDNEVSYVKRGKTVILKMTKKS